MSKKKSKILRYSDEMLFTVYELAANGLKGNQIADALKIPYLRYKRWRRRYPLMKVAYKQGVTIRKERNSSNRPTESIDQYVFKRLSPALKPLWNKLKSFDREPDAAKRIESLLSDKGKAIRQQLFLHSLMYHSFNMTRAMRQCNLSFSTLNNWKVDQNFASLLDEIVFYKKDFVDSKVMEAVEMGQPWAIQLAAKGLLKDTYGDQQKIVVEGNISHDHRHEFVPVEKLSLPTRKLVMQELEAAEKDRIEDAEILAIKEKRKDT